MKTFKQYENEDLNTVSEEEQLAAVKKDGYAIDLISDPSEEVQLAAVQQNGYTIRFISDPLEEVKLAAVEQNGLAIYYIYNPSLEVQKLVIQKGYIDSIKFLSKEIQEWFIKQAPSNILKIHKNKLDPELAVKYSHLIKMGSAGILK